jgi:hypothetical protein
VNPAPAARKLGQFHINNDGPASPTSFKLASRKFFVAPGSTSIAFAEIA